MAATSFSQQPSSFSNILLHLEDYSHLDLSEKCTEAHTQALATTLSTNTSLRSLNLARNPLGETGSIALGLMLTVNSTLTSLNLHGAQIGKSGGISKTEAL